MILPPEILIQVMRRLDQQQLLRLGLVDKQWLLLSSTALQQLVVHCPEHDCRGKIFSLAQWLRHRGNHLQVSSLAGASRLLLHQFFIVACRHL
jgi:hypothetical protein